MDNLVAWKLFNYYDYRETNFPDKDFSSYEDLILETSSKKGPRWSL